MVRVLVTVLFSTAIVMVGLFTLAMAVAGGLESENFTQIYRSLNSPPTALTIRITPAGEGLLISGSRPSRRSNGKLVETDLNCKDFDTVSGKILELVQKIDLKDDNGE